MPPEIAERLADWSAREPFRRAATTAPSSLGVYMARQGVQGRTGTSSTSAWRASAACRHPRPMAVYALPEPLRLVWNRFGMSPY